MTQAITRRMNDIEPSNNGNFNAGQMTAIQVKSQVHLIQEIMRDVMQDKHHYGTIPGCGDKPTLLKPGAEKLGMTFRLAPSFSIQIDNMENGHREYRITCTLTHIDSGKVLGEGVGSCSTMESKYRYRGASSPDKMSDVSVPPDYWKQRKANAKPEILQKILSDAIGEPGRYGTKKNDSDQWMITVRGERTEGKVENPDIADTYNTVLKMGKKRAQVDAILTATAASDIFTQDIEDFAPDAPPTPAQQQPNDAEPQTFLDTMFDALDAQGLDDKKQATAQDMARAKYKVKDLNDLSDAQWGKFLAAIREGKFNQVKEPETPSEGAADAQDQVGGESHRAEQSNTAAPALTWPTFLIAVQEAAMDWEVAPSDLMAPINAKVLGLRKKDKEDTIKPETLASWLALAKSGELWGKGK